LYNKSIPIKPTARKNKPMYTSIAKSPMNKLPKPDRVIKKTGIANT